MKKALLICLSTCYFLTAFAQDATLTKGETVSYLKKKMQECEGFTSKSGRVVKDIELKMVDNNLTLSYSEYYPGDHSFRSNQLCLSYEYEFNPLDIKKLSSSTDCNSTMCTVTILLTSKIGKQKVRGSNGCGSSDEREPYTHSISFFYLVKDGTNEKKIHKALLHLQALLKAEDDPFGD